MRQKESLFKRGLRKKIEDLFDGNVIVVQPSTTTSPAGYPDYIFLIPNGWFALEAKNNASSAYTTMQIYWGKMFDDFSYWRKVTIDNEKEVLSEIKKLFVDGAGL